MRVDLIFVLQGQGKARAESSSFEVQQARGNSLQEREKCVC